MRSRSFKGGPMKARKVSRSAPPWRPSSTVSTGGRSGVPWEILQFHLTSLKNLYRCQDISCVFTNRRLSSLSLFDFFQNIFTGILSIQSMASFLYTYFFGWWRALRFLSRQKRMTSSQKSLKKTVQMVVSWGL